MEFLLCTLLCYPAVYERILDMKVATPQMILNYAVLLEENQFFEDAFRVYERGVSVWGECWRRRLV